MLTTIHVIDYVVIFVYVVVFVIVFSVLALAFVPLHGSGFEKEPYIYFNMYTGPGFLSALLGIINILLVVFLFKESKLIKPEAKKMRNVDRSHHGT